MGPGEGLMEEGPRWGRLWYSAGAVAEGVTQACQDSTFNDVGATHRRAPRGGSKARTKRKGESARKKQTARKNNIFGSKEKRCSEGEERNSRRAASAWAWVLAVARRARCAAGTLHGTSADASREAPSAPGHQAGVMQQLLQCCKPWRQQHKKQQAASR